MNSLLLEFKNRINLLNIIRLVVGISLIGEAIHSKSIIFGLIGAVFLVQIALNKKCGAEGCNIEEQ